MMLPALQRHPELRNLALSRLDMADLKSARQDVLTAYPMIDCNIARPWQQLRVALQCKPAPCKQVMINIASIVMLMIYGKPPLQYCLMLQCSTYSGMTFTLALAWTATSFAKFTLVAH